MKRIRYTMPARSQGKLYTQRAMARLVEEDVHRWVFAYGSYRGLQAMYTPHFTGTAQARTHIVPMSLQGAQALAAVKAVVEATGHLPVCGRPFCLDNVNNVEGGAM